MLDEQKARMQPHTRTPDGADVRLLANINLLVDLTQANALDFSMGLASLNQLNMATLTLRNATGSDAGTVELDDEIFGIEPNVAVMHQVVTAQLAARRSGTQSTKTRREVSGGGAKPFRQKGTGNARQGSTNSPQFTGGGIAHGPKPRKYNQKTPKKMVKLATRSALSDRAADGKVVVTRTTNGGRSFRILRKGLPQKHAYDLVLRHALDVGSRHAAGSFDRLPAARLDVVEELERELDKIHQNLSRTEKEFPPSLLRKFFDHLDHQHLRQFLRVRVRDGVLLRLIDKWLKAGVMEDGNISYPDSGSPQGGVISPLISNIFLHYVLDLWFEQDVKPRLRDKAFLIRFADDFVIGFRDLRDAQRVMEVVPKRFGKYGLTVHPTKTKLVPFRPPSSTTSGASSQLARAPALTSSIASSARDRRSS